MGADLQLQSIVEIDGKYESELPMEWKVSPYRSYKGNLNSTDKKYKEHYRQHLVSFWDKFSKNKELKRAEYILLIDMAIGAFEGNKAKVSINRNMVEIISCLVNLTKRYVALANDEKAKICSMAGINQFSLSMSEGFKRILLGVEKEGMLAGKALGVLQVLKFMAQRHLQTSRINEELRTVNVPLLELANKAYYKTYGEPAYIAFLKNKENSKSVSVEITKEMTLHYQKHADYLEPAIAVGRECKVGLKLGGGEFWDLYYVLGEALTQTKNMIGEVWVVTPLLPDRVQLKKGRQITLNITVDAANTLLRHIKDELSYSADAQLQNMRLMYGAF